MHVILQRLTLHLLISDSHNAREVPLQLRDKTP